MAFTVTIDYFGVVAEPEAVAASICAIFQPTNSYIDLPVMKEGYEVGAEDADKKYGKSIYATNVDGFGSVKMPEPYASTSIPMSVPLAQFKLAVVGEYDDTRKCHTVSFEVDNYQEAFYYKQVGEQIKDQGFVVTVQETAANSGAGTPETPKG